MVAVFPISSGNSWLFSSMTVTMCIATKSLQGFSFLYTHQFGELSFDIFLLFWQWGGLNQGLMPPRQVNLLSHRVRFLDCLDSCHLTEAIACNSFELPFWMIENVQCSLVRCVFSRKNVLPTLSPIFFLLKIYLIIFN